MVGRQFPKLEAMLRDAAEDLLAFTSFPPSGPCCWRCRSSTRSGPRNGRTHEGEAAADAINRTIAVKQRIRKAEAWRLLDWVRQTVSTDLQ
jgi:hypothetical protein